jgi:hypothetical protein
MTGSKITGLEYPWSRRPAYVPLTSKEMTIAFELVKFDVCEAARLLKTDIERVRSALLFHENAHLMRKVVEVIFAPLVSIQENGPVTVIRITRPPYAAECRVHSVFDGLVVEIERKHSKLEALRRAAERVPENNVGE